MTRGVRIFLLCLAACGAPDSTSAPGEAGDASATTDVPDHLSESSSPTTGTSSTSSTSSTGDTSAGAASSSTDGPCDYICPLDAAPVPGCDDGWDVPCPEGQKCTAYGAGDTWDAMKCVPVMDDPAQPGEGCFVVDGLFSGVDNCDLGSMCWNLDAEGNGVCIEHCHDAGDLPTCTDPATLCYRANDGVLSLCLTRCDPLLQDCARDEDECIAHPNGDGFICVFDASGDGGAIFSPCEQLNACDEGLACVTTSPAAECDPNAPGCCLPFCDLAAPDPNAPCTGEGQQCVPFFDPDVAPLGVEDVGVCAIPP